MSRMIDTDVIEKIKTGEIKWISPSIWPEENSIEIIQNTDGSTVEVVHDYKGLHYAFVDEPAYGVESEIKSFCDGTTKSCQIDLARFDTSIDNVAPLTERKIKLSNTSTDQNLNTSHKNNSSSKTQMATDEELRKDLEDAKKALKTTSEELEKLKDEEAKKDQEEEDKEKKQEGKKAEDKKKDDEEKQGLKAQIESLTAQAKLPIIDKIVSAQLSASVISSDSESKVRDHLMKASIDSLTQQYELIKPFETKLNSLSASHNTVPYYGRVTGDSFDASLDEIDIVR